MGIQRLPPLDWLLHCRRTNMNMSRAGSRFHQESIADITANHICIRQRFANACTSRYFVYHNKKAAIRLLCKDNGTPNRIILIADTIACRAKTNLHPRARTLKFVRYRFIRRVIQFNAKGRAPSSYSIRDVLPKRQTDLPQNASNQSLPPPFFHHRKSVW